MKWIKERILNVEVDAAQIDDIISQLVFSINDNNKLVLSCINPHSVVVCQKDRIFHDALLNSDFNIPDGAGIVWASRFLGGNIRARVTGSDIFHGLNDYLNKKGGTSCFFIGSSEDTLGKIRTRMADEFPNVKIAGTYSPPFKEIFTEEENQDMLDAVNRSDPDVLWVGMTAPKQEKWIYQNREKLNARVIAAVGAVFDFYAGTKRRSTRFWQDKGLEWLPRFMREPRRLWRRNLVSSPMFIYLVLKERVGRGRF